MGLYFQDPAELDKAGFGVCVRVLAATDEDVHFRIVSISPIPRISSQTLFISLLYSQSSLLTGKQLFASNLGVS